MIVVYSFFPGDQDLALRNAEWLVELGGCKGHEALMIYDQRCGPQAEYVEQELNKSFGKVHTICAKAEFDGWPQGANYFFRLATSWLQNGGKWPYFFWMEPDAIILKEGALDALQGEFERVARPAGKFFMGDRVQVENVPLHLSGVAIYPNPLHAYAGEAYRASDVAWDIAGKDQIVPRAHFTKLIEHAWRHPSFTMDSEIETQIRPEAVIFHSSKDGSLITLLQNRRRGNIAGVQVESSQKDGKNPIGLSDFSCDIFIRTYKKDYPWLHYCLRSINKFCTGFRKIWIVSPDEALWDEMGYEWKTVNDESPDGYLAQQITKLYADVITDYAADYILFVDSDNVFTQPTSPHHFFEDGKPVWPFTPYSAIETPWQPITEKFMGKPVANEFMRRFPILIPRWLFPKLREYCYGKHGRIISEYVRTQPLRSFSEFNALGAFAYEFHRDKFFWVNTLNNPLPPPFARQFHSYSGITEEVKAEIEQILSGSTIQRANQMEDAGVEAVVLPPQTPSIKKLPNNIWVLENEQLSEWVEKAGRLDHDPNLLPVILSHIKEGDTVVDAGAFIGDHSIAYLKSVGGSGEVYAFEPNPVAFECLVHNVDSSTRITAYQAALGDKRDTVPLSANNGVVSGGYIGDHMKVADVRMEPLDSFGIKPNLIKIDVEGCELKMLRGAERTIEEYHPIMVIEINKGALERQGATPDQIFDWLKVHGYNWSIIESNAIVHDPLYNILALPISRSGRSDGNKSGGIEQSSSPASGTSQETFTGGTECPKAQKDAEVLTCCPSASPPVTPFSVTDTQVAILKLKEFVAESNYNRQVVMVRLAKAGLTPRWRNKKKKK